MPSYHCSVTGNVTTVYYVEEHGDPNEGCNPDDEESTEQQYLIKWKGWSHIHNTWESEKSLAEQKVKGLKKLENYIKKEAELSWWRQQACPEDIDYFECQSELQHELVKTYNSVERIFGKKQLLSIAIYLFTKLKTLLFIISRDLRRQKKLNNFHSMGLFN